MNYTFLLVSYLKSKDRSTRKSSKIKLQRENKETTIAGEDGSTRGARGLEGQMVNGAEDALTKGSFTLV